MKIIIFIILIFNKLNFTVETNYNVIQLKSLCSLSYENKCQEFNKDLVILNNLMIEMIYSKSFNNKPCIIENKLFIEKIIYCADEFSIEKNISILKKNFLEYVTFFSDDDISEAKKESDLLFNYIKQININYNYFFNYLFYHYCLNLNHLIKNINEFSLCNKTYPCINFKTFLFNIHNNYYEISKNFHDIEKIKTVNLYMIESCFTSYYHRILLIEKILNENKGNPIIYILFNSVSRLNTPFFLLSQNEIVKFKENFIFQNNYLKNLVNNEDSDKEFFMLNYCFKISALEFYINKQENKQKSLLKNNKNYKNHKVNELLNNLKKQLQKTFTIMNNKFINHSLFIQTLQEEKIFNHSGIKFLIQLNVFDLNVMFQIIQFLHPINKYQIYIIQTMINAYKPIEILNFKQQKEILLLRENKFIMDNILILDDKKIDDEYRKEGLESYKQKKQCYLLYLNNCFKHYFILLAEGFNLNLINIQ